MWSFRRKIMLCCNNVLRIVSQSLKPQSDSLCLTSSEWVPHWQVCSRMDGESSCLLLRTSSPFPSTRRRWRSRQSLKVWPRCLNSGCGAERGSPGSCPARETVLFGKEIMCEICWLDDDEDGCGVDGNDNDDTMCLFSLSPKTNRYPIPDSNPKYF